MGETLSFCEWTSFLLFIFASFTERQRGETERRCIAQSHSSKLLMTPKDTKVTCLTALVDKNVWHGDSGTLMVIGFGEDELDKYSI